MANPMIQKATHELDKQYQKQIRKDAQRIQKEAGKQKQDWEPQQEDTDTITKYMADAYRARTSPGIDGITPDIFIFAGEMMDKAIHRILQIIAASAKTPKEWGKLRIVLALKPGRDPQNIRKSYRPIGVGSLLLKAIERVVKTQYDRALKEHPLHKAIMAYQKKIGHEMAVYTVKGAILHERYETPGCKK
jgi:hypothetical protein